MAVNYINSKLQEAIDKTLSFLRAEAGGAIPLTSSDAQELIEDLTTALEVKEEPCVFCKIVIEEIDADIVHENDHCIAIKDKNPQAKEHHLILMKRHLKSLTSADADHAVALGHMLLLAADLHNLPIKGYRCIINTGKDACDDCPWRP